MSKIDRWPTWIKRSVQVYMADQLAGYEVFEEGSQRATNTVQDSFEVRVDGPYLKKEDATSYNGRVDLNILVSTAMDVRDVAKQSNMEGLVLKAIAQNICVYRYGDKPFDDGTLESVLQLLTDGRFNVNVTQFGQIDPQYPIMQSTVSAHYRVDLEDN